MTIIQQLKAESLRLRKERSPIAPSITFAISEIEKVGKNAGNRDTTEDEAIKSVQKMIATIEENLKVVSDDGRKVSFNYEKQILQSVLPQMVSEDEITNFLRELFTTKRNDDIPKKGDIMKAFKVKFGALVDMKQVGAIAYELYGVQ